LNNDSFLLEFFDTLKSGNTAALEDLQRCKQCRCVLRAGIVKEVNIADQSGVAVVNDRLAADHDATHPVEVQQSDDSRISGEK
jgi:hypothetical protein